MTIPKPAPDGQAPSRSPFADALQAEDHESSIGLSSCGGGGGGTSTAGSGSGSGPGGTFDDFMQNVIVPNADEVAITDFPILLGEFNSVYSNPGKQSVSIVNGLFTGMAFGELLNDGVPLNTRSGFAVLLFNLDQTASATVAAAVPQGLVRPSAGGLLSSGGAFAAGGAGSTGTTGR